VPAYPGCPGKEAFEWVSVSYHNRFTALFGDHPCEPVPEENFWTLWCKGRLTEADTPTIRLGATPARLSSADLHHPPFFTGWMLFLPPTNSVKALKALCFKFILLINDVDSVKSTGLTAEVASSAVGNESSDEQSLSVSDVPGLLGILLGLRSLTPLMCDASLTAADSAFQLKGSFGATVAETDTHVDIVLVLRVRCFNLSLIFKKM